MLLVKKHHCSVSGEQVCVVPCKVLRTSPRRSPPSSPSPPRRPGSCSDADRRPGNKHTTRNMRRDNTHTHTHTHTKVCKTGPAGIHQKQQNHLFTGDVWRPCRHTTSNTGSVQMWYQLRCNCECSSRAVGHAAPGRSSSSRRSAHRDSVGSDPAAPPPCWSSAAAAKQRILDLHQ